MFYIEYDIRVDLLLKFSLLYSYFFIPRLLPLPAHPLLLPDLSHTGGPGGGTGLNGDADREGNDGGSYTEDHGSTSGQ